jgi:hypothetical protein
MPLKLTAQNQALALPLKIAGRFFASDAILGCFARRMDPAVLPGAQAIVQPFNNWLGHPAKFPLGFRLGASESLARWLRYPLQNRLFHVRAVCRGMDEALRRLGFTGGKVLEPAAGTCAFWPAESPDWSCDGSAGEIDHVSGSLHSQLPPEAKVQIGGLATTTLTGGTFDLAAGNVSFGGNPTGCQARCGHCNRFCNRQVKTRIPPVFAIIAESEKIKARTPHSTIESAISA